VSRVLENQLLQPFVNPGVYLVAGLSHRRTGSSFVVALTRSCCFDRIKTDPAHQISAKSLGAARFLPLAPVAQLDRANGYEPLGREFESLRAHHIPFYFSRKLDPSLRSGFRLEAPASLTPPNASSSNLSGRTISLIFHRQSKIPRSARDFGWRLPLRSRLQNASSSNLSGRTIIPLIPDSEVEGHLAPCTAIPVDVFTPQNTYQTEVITGNRTYLAIGYLDY
jgi:hypothetical protein